MEELLLHPEDYFHLHLLLNNVSSCSLVSMTLALYMPSADVNLIAQSSPENTWEKGRLVETWSSLSMRMSRANWEVAGQNQRDNLSWQT